MVLTPFNIWNALRSLIKDGLVLCESVDLILITMSAVREWAASQNSKLLEAVAVNNLGKWKTATQMTALTILLASRDSSEFDMKEIEDWNSFWFNVYLESGKQRHANSRPLPKLGKADASGGQCWASAQDPVHRRAAPRVVEY
ncbi:hypothetical protein QJS10_CPB20g00735 [Acorus calamus]|uniref:Uncharacterized protein n=1 Tax=Acorus calamus TaxID=4465 RepID=A0AAV9CAC5_ACOCL|nr:hypothetical protein QJS10_CPB20g00735 [Acorus calamus]